MRSPSPLFFLSAQGSRIRGPENDALRGGEAIGLVMLFVVTCRQRACLQEDAFVTLHARQASALVVSSTRVGNNANKIVSMAASHNPGTIYPGPAMRARCLMSDGSSISFASTRRPISPGLSQGRQAGLLVRFIRLPNSELSSISKTAEALGLTVPHPLLPRARRQVIGIDGAIHRGLGSRVALRRSWRAQQRRCGASACSCGSTKTDPGANSHSSFTQALAGMGWTIGPVAEDLRGGDDTNRIPSARRMVGLHPINPGQSARRSLPVRGRRRRSRSSLPGAGDPVSNRNLSTLDRPIGTPLAAPACKPPVQAVGLSALENRCPVSAGRHHDSYTTTTPHHDFTTPFETAARSLKSR